VKNTKATQTGLRGHEYEQRIKDRAVEMIVTEGWGICTGAKARRLLVGAARLKSCPDTNHLEAGLKSGHNTNHDCVIPGQDYFRGGCAT